MLKRKCVAPMAVLAALCALLAAGCAAPFAAGFVAPAAVSSQADASPQGDAKSPVGQAAATQAAAPQGALELGEKWYAFRVAAGGQVLELPCPVANLAGLGWQAGAGLDEMMQPGEYADVKFTAAAGFLAARVGNPGPAPLALGECSAVALVFYGTADETPMALPGGVGLGSGYDEVLAAWGQPDAHLATGTAVLHYSTGRHDFIGLAFESGRAVRIELQRLKAPAAPPENLPAEVLAYAAPEALGADVWDYDILYDGDLYTLPAPVAAFLENGWVLRDEGVVQPGGFLMGVTLCRGNQRLRTRLMNFSDTAQPLGGCFVVMAESSLASMQVPLTVAGGLAESATYDEALALLGPPDETYWEKVIVRRTTLTWHGPDGKLVLRFTGEPGEMELYDLEVWHTALG